MHRHCCRCLLVSLAAGHPQLHTASRKHHNMTVKKAGGGRRRAILVNTPGGSASTLVLEALYKAGVATNNRFNREANLKHGNANVQRRRLGACETSPTGRCVVWTSSQGVEWAFDRVLYIVGNPAKAVASTARRWPSLQHYFNLQAGCGECWHAPSSGEKRSKTQLNRLKRPPTWRDKKGSALYRAIFQSSAALGRDAYGVQAHFDSWVRAQRNETSDWPPILIADLATLLDEDFQCALFAFLGISDDLAVQRVVQAELRHPDDLVLGLNHHTDRGVSPPTPEDLMNAAARAIYANLTSAIDRVIQDNKQTHILHTPHTPLRSRPLTTINKRPCA